METLNSTEKSIQQSRLNLTNRSNLSLSGVTKVVSATNGTVAVMFGKDSLQIDGVDLSVTKLDVDNKILELTGTVNSLRFNKSKNTNGKTFLKRIFG